MYSIIKKIYKIELPLNFYKVFFLQNLYNI